MRRHATRFAALVVASIVLLIGAAGASFSAVPRVAAQVEWAPPRAVYVPATGHTVSGAFLDAWRAWGAAPAWGNPVTEEATEAGRVVQYFEYARLEHWPEDPTGEIVHLGRVGAELRPFAIPRRPLPGTSQDAARMLLAWVPLADGSATGSTSDTRRVVPETGHSVQAGFRAFWEATGAGAYLGNPLTEEYQLGGRTYQIFERGQLAWEPGALPYMVPVGRMLAEGRGLDLAPVAQVDVPSYSEDLFVPPPPPEPVVPEPEPILPVPEPVAPQPDPNAERWIEVNLGTQYLIAWQGDFAVLEAFVSTGRAGFETPTGTYFINTKLESEDMEGVIGGEYYNVPDVPWVMYFTDAGHALHGTYWHNNFGVPMSHGCVNLPMWAAEVLYAWAPLGARVEIH